MYITWVKEKNDEKGSHRQHKVYLWDTLADKHTYVQSSAEFFSSPIHNLGESSTWEKVAEKNMTR